MRRGCVTTTGRGGGLLAVGGSEREDRSAVGWGGVKCVCTWFQATNVSFFVVFDFHISVPRRPARII